MSNNTENLFLYNHYFGRSLFDIKSYTEEGNCTEIMLSCFHPTPYIKTLDLSKFKA